MSQLIAVAPYFDDVTQYSLDWCKWTIGQIKDYISTSELYDELAVKDRVLEEIHKEPKAKFFCHYDHGSDYVMYGDDAQAIIDLSNLSELAGMHVYCMNCRSGKGLGVHAIDKEIKEYLGYVQEYAFTTDAVEEHKQATGFGLVKALQEDKDLVDVVDAMRQNGYSLADTLRAQGKWMAAGALVSDMNSLVCYPGHEKPTPECMWSRMIAAVFGWKALWFLRMARQKLHPERPLRQI